MIVIWESFGDPFSVKFLFTHCGFFHLVLSLLLILLYRFCSTTSSGVSSAVLGASALKVGMPEFPGHKQLRAPVRPL